jgi:hypothetical protein
LYFVGCLQQDNAYYRDKKVVGVFVRFSCRFMYLRWVVRSLATRKNTGQRPGPQAESWAASTADGCSNSATCLTGWWRTVPWPVAFQSSVTYPTIQINSSSLNPAWVCSYEPKRDRQTQRWATNGFPVSTYLPNHVREWNNLCNHLVSWAYTKVVQTVYDFFHSAATSPGIMPLIWQIQILLNLGNSQLTGVAQTFNDQIQITHHI